MSTSTDSTSNPILARPWLSATIFAIAVFCVFVGALYNSATSHHEGGASHGAPHGGEHKAAPAAH
ncbi:MAG TPA: hypothetical protein PK156_35130 [Polyangium sp.]|nr:hypothetical protein [Polyangium sp.]